MERFNYPFTAAPGMEKLKRALLLCAVEPLIGGVLIAGEKGTGKSTLCRGLSELIPQVPFTNLPLNITEDRFVGSIHAEESVKKGRVIFQDGLLQQVHNSILYIDEVNLLPDRIVHILMEIGSSGMNHVEREGISITQPSQFIMVGSMNPEEGAAVSGFYGSIRPLRRSSWRNRSENQMSNYEKASKL